MHKRLNPYDFHPKEAGFGEDAPLSLQVHRVVNLIACCFDHGVVHFS